MREPDFKGVGAWRAWAIRLRPAGARGEPDWDATLGLWLLECPGAHLAWSQWTIGVVHLRPIAGVRPPVKRYPAAEYELLCAALNPEVSIDPDAPPLPLPWLSPIDWVVQFHGVTDRDAVRIAESAIRLIMSGRVSPDTDFRRFWEETIPATARHFAAGAHPEN